MEVTFTNRHHIAPHFAYLEAQIKDGASMVLTIDLECLTFMARKAIANKSRRCREAGGGLEMKPGSLHDEQAEKAAKALGDMETMAAKARAYDRISEILFPGGDTEHEWENDTLDEVAAVVYGLGVHVR